MGERDTFVETSSSTSRRSKGAHAGAGRLCLVVIGEGLDATFPLPDEGRVAIGRSEQADVRIDHRSVSRNHAVLDLDRMTIEDLGSSNGTRVKECWIPRQVPTEISLGEPIDIGKAMVVVQQRAVPSAQRHIWAHGYFEARIEEECARAERSGSRFAVMRMHCARGDGAVEGAIARTVRTMDVIGYYGPAEYEALIVDATPEAIAALTTRVTSALDELGVAVRTGAAFYPDDARDPYTLLRKAGAVAIGERPSSVDVDRPVMVADAAMQNLDKIVHRIAAGTISVLITGETGVGKEVLAERLHKLSPRADHPFLRLNCAALSESLLESELFGHERGSFTGAVATKQGLLETAERGTVFLDEIGELPMTIQVKLLRVLEERKVLRVGALKPREIDVRFLSATNRDLEAEIERGTFRQDLYFRLNGISLVIPPLRERLGETAELARVFVRQACERGGRDDVPELSREALAMLQRYDWPGNIRELRNVIERAVLLCADGTIREEHLPTEKMRDARRQVRTITRPPPRAPEPEPPPGPLDTIQPPERDRSEDRARIIDALNRTGGNQTDAAKLLGISRRTLINRVIALGIPRPRKK